ncbi:MAG: XRE family transcriptional regulator [Lachnospiraceae bacterium]|nr:XRE family transcriptional regulator [Lachnospiraceae bacterium]
MTLPTIDMIKTGQNIGRLRRQAGLSVKDLQDIFGFATPQAIYKWQQASITYRDSHLPIVSCVQKQE